MIILNSISDISPGQFAEHLEEVGYTLGVMNMSQAYLLVEPYMGEDGKTGAFFITQDNYFEMARLFYSMAVFNYACYVYEDFAILSIEIEKAHTMRRSHSQAQHQLTMLQCLQHIEFIITKYGIPRYSAGS